MASLYGLLAEFETPDEIIRAARSAFDAGYRKMDAYTPFPVEGLNEAIGFHKNEMPLIVLLGGLAGCIGGYLLQMWAMVWSYPLNVGGRPLNSWPSFIPVTFEMTILCAGISAVFGMLALNGLPMPYHPVFNVERFAMASRSRFFLCIEARDPRFNLDQTRQFLQSLNPKGVYDVEP
jgi:hypothetical protein